MDIRPLPALAHLYNGEEALKKYPAMSAHDKLVEELRAINLVPKQSYASRDEAQISE